MFTRSRYSLVLLSLVASIGCSQSASDNGTTGIQPGARVEWISDDAIVLGALGETASLNAVIRNPDGSISASAPIVWESSDPTKVQVDSHGNVTASSGLGAAVISASALGAQAAHGTVVIAPPKPRTHLIPNRAIIEHADGYTTLETRSIPPDIRVGDIVVSGSKARLLGRVTSLSSSGSYLTVKLASVSLVEAFDELDIDLVSPAAPFLVTMTPTRRRVSLRIQDDDSSSRVEGAFESLFEDMKCTAGDRDVDVRFGGGMLSWNHAWTLRTVLKSKGLRVERFQVSVEGRISAAAKTGTLTVHASELAFTCKLALPSIAIPVVSVGPLAVGASISPSIGLRASGKFPGSEIRLEGPSVAANAEIAFGAGYQDKTGLFPIQQFDVTDVRTAPGSFMVTTPESWDLKVGPFVEAKASISADVGPFNLASIDFAALELRGTYHSTMQPPFEYRVPEYRGPRWAVDVGTALHVGLDVHSPIFKLLDKVGVPINNPRVDVLDLNRDWKVLQSPDLTAQAMTEDGHTIVRASIPTRPISYTGKRVEFWSWDPKGPRMLGHAPVDATGHADTQVQSAADPLGNIKAFLFDDLHGRMDLPYTTRQPLVISP